MIAPGNQLAVIVIVANQFLMRTLDWLALRLTQAQAQTLESEL